MLILKSVLFAAVVPGTVVPLIPYLIVSSEPARTRTGWEFADYGALILPCIGQRSFEEPALRRRFGGAYAVLGQLT